MTAQTRGASGPLFGTAERFTRWLAAAGVACLLAAMLVTMADVLLRGAARASVWLFDQPLTLAVPGVVDIIQLLVMATAYLAMPYAFMTGSHVAVELVSDRFPPRVLSLVNGLAAVLALAFMAAATWYGAEAAAQQHGYGDASHTIAIPILWYWAPLLVGAALSVAATALLALGHFARALIGPP